MDKVLQDHIKTLLTYKRMISISIGETEPDGNGNYDTPFNYSVTSINLRTAASVLRLIAQRLDEQADGTNAVNEANDIINDKK